jgi:adenosine deaminase
MTEQQKHAIELMLEDLYTIRSDIRKESKMFGCEQELLQIRDDIVEYLKSYEKEMECSRS